MAFQNNEATCINSSSNQWGKSLIELPEKSITTASKSDMEEKYKSLLTYYTPFMQNNIAPNTKRQKGENITNWMFRYEKDSAWQSITIPEYKGDFFWRGYYRTNINIPSDIMSMKRICLHFEGVDTVCSVTVNGTYIGSHRCSIDPFDMDITNVVKQNNNLIELEVINGWSPMGAKERAAQMGTVIPAENEFFKITGEWGNMNGKDRFMGGIWRNVYVIGTDDVWIDTLYAEADPDSGTVVIEGSIKSYGDREELISFNIIPKNFEGSVIEGLENISIKNGIYYFKKSFFIENIKLWEAESPYLYLARVSVDKENGDSRDVSFGFKSLVYDSTINRYRLNNKPFVYLGVTTTNSLNMAYVNGDIDRVIKIILLAKVAGFTIMRSHILSTIQEIDDYFDMLGMAVQQEMDLWQEITPDIIDESIRELGIMINQHRSHPSSFFYSLCSEPNNALYTEYIKKASIYMQDNFPLLEWRIESGGNFLDKLDWIHAKKGDAITKGGSKNVADVHLYPGWYGSVGTLTECNNSEIPVTVGEFGAEGLSDYDTMLRWPKDNPNCSIPANPDMPASTLPKGQYKAGNKGLFVPTPLSLREWINETQEYQSFLSGYITEYLRRSRQLAGYYYYFLDEAVPNGWRKTLLDCELTPKPAYFKMAKLNSRVLVSVYIDRPHVYTGDNLCANIWVCNSGDKVECTKLSWYIIDAEGLTVYADVITSDIKAAVPECKKKFVFSIPHNSVKGSWQLRVCLKDSNGLTLYCDDTQFIVYDALSQINIADDKIVFVNPTQELEKALPLIINGVFVVISELESDSQLSNVSVVVICKTSIEKKSTKDILAAYVRNGGKLLFLQPTKNVYDWLLSGLSCIEKKRNKIGIDENSIIFSGVTKSYFMLWDSINGDRSPIENAITFRGLDISRTKYTGKIDDNTRWSLQSLAEVTQTESVLLWMEYGFGSILFSGFGMTYRIANHPVPTILFKNFITTLLQGTNPISNGKCPYENNYIS